MYISLRDLSLISPAGHQAVLTSMRPAMPAADAPPLDTSIKSACSPQIPENRLLLQMGESETAMSEAGCTSCLIPPAPPGMQAMNIEHTFATFQVYLEDPLTPDTSTMSKPLNPAREARPHFPALTDEFIFGDNAGGSQILRDSVDAISNYLLTTNVQMGGGYMHSVEAANRVEKGKEAAAVLTNVIGGADQIVIGSSTTQLASNLGHACSLAGKGHGLFELNDEIIISAADHEGE